MNTPIRSDGHVCPFMGSSDFNYPHLSFEPDCSDFNTPIPYCELTASVVDYALIEDPIDECTGQSLAPPRPPRQHQFDEIEAEDDESTIIKHIYFRIKVQANHIRTEVKGHVNRELGQQQAATQVVDVKYNVSWYLFRRYSEFDRLYQSLSQYYQNIPRLPPKETFSFLNKKNTNLNQLFQHNRRLGLSQWLSSIILTIPAALHTEDFNNFLRLSDHIKLDTSELPKRLFHSNPQSLPFGVTDLHWDEARKLLYATNEDDSLTTRVDSKTSHIFSANTGFIGALSTLNFTSSSGQHNDMQSKLEEIKKTPQMPLDQFNQEDDQADPRNTSFQRRRSSAGQQLPRLAYHQQVAPFIDQQNDLIFTSFGVDDVRHFQSRASCLCTNEFEPFAHHLPAAWTHTTPHPVPSTQTHTNFSINTPHGYISHITPKVQPFEHNQAQIGQRFNETLIFAGLDNGEIQVFQHFSPGHPQYHPSNPFVSQNTLKYHTNRIEKISYVRLYPSPLSTLSIDQLLALPPVADSKELVYEGIISSSRDGNIVFFDLAHNTHFPLFDTVICQYGAIAHHHWNQYTQTIYFTTFNGYICSYQILINTRTKAIIPQPLHVIHYSSSCLRSIKPLTYFATPFFTQNAQHQYLSNYSHDSLFGINNYETNNVDIWDLNHANQSFHTIKMQSQERFNKLLFSIPLLKTQCKRILILPLYLPFSSTTTAQSTQLYSSAQPTTVAPTQNFLIGHNSPAQSTPFFYLFTGHSDGCLTISIFNVYKRTSTLLYVLGAHHSEITGISYIPERDLVLTTSRDRTIAGFKIPFPRSWIERIL